jgi:hypothetical protein
MSVVVVLLTARVVQLVSVLVRARLRAQKAFLLCICMRTWNDHEIIRKMSECSVVCWPSTTAAMASITRLHDVEHDNHTPLSLPFHHRSSRRRAQPSNSRVQSRPSHSPRLCVCVLTRTLPHLVACCQAVHICELSPVERHVGLVVPDPGLRAVEGSPERIA